MSDLEPFLDVLDAELAAARRRLVPLVDRLDALAEVWRRATLLQAATRNRHVTVIDLERQAARTGEVERARLAGLIARITQGDSNA